MMNEEKKEVISLDIFTFDCTGCERCIRHCSSGVLDIVDNGFCRYVIVRYLKNCNGCGKCLQACNTNAMRLITRKKSSIINKIKIKQ